MEVQVSVETPVSTSPRAKQLEGLFDVPHQPHQRIEWSGDVPIEEHKWNVGLILGPSGAGKSILLTHMFGEMSELAWDAPAIVDDFAGPMEEVAAVCQAVGFNTIPAWLRPHSVLSNGEQFRAGLARRLLETPAGQPIVVDEFTSVVDRQVAQIGSHAAAKWVRRHDRRFVAASCHYDIVDWLQPDWVLEPAGMRFCWRSVQPRPQLDATISPVPYAAWELFAPYHYLTANLHRSARCWCLFVADAPTVFAGVIRRPHPKARNIMGVSRLVTLPDWQGLGLAFVLLDALGSMYRAIGERLRMYPAHPALVRSFDRSKVWALTKRPHHAPLSSQSPTSTVRGGFGGRPNAVFEYRGPAGDPVVMSRCRTFWAKSGTVDPSSLGV